MAKNGRLTPKAWGPFMPVHNSNSQKGPWYYRDIECVLIEFETDPDYVLNILPSDLELYEPAIAFIVLETNRNTTVGDYSEVYNGVLCKWKGEVYAYIPGVYVTGENALVLGREIWGFGKKLAKRIEIIRHQDGQVEAAMDVKAGDRALRALVRTARMEPADSIAPIPMICLRVVPDAEGGDKPALAQLITVLPVNKPIIAPDGRPEIYSGPGHLQFDSPSDAQLPIRKILSCKYARLTSDLPYGKILKTYSDKELQAK
jgi:acetoacetate decarboxylase